MNNLSSILTKFIVGLFAVLLLIIIYYTVKPHNPVKPSGEVTYHIELKGQTIVELYRYEEYQEAGYSAYDSEGNDLTDEVIVTNPVDSTKKGTYTIIYALGDVKVMRDVVVKYDLAHELNIVLNGDSEVYILKNKEYQDLGAKAYDVLDEDLTNRIIVTSNVNTSVTGEYQVMYTITNSRNDTKTIKRKVIVYDVLYQLEEKNIDNKYIVTFTFTNEYFKKLLLPNNNVILSKSSSYTIEANGNYVFIIYDIYGNMIEKEIKVTSIDNYNPIGTCVLELYDTYSYIKVNANDDTGISGYQYQYGSYKTGKIEYNSYSYYEDIREASVIVYDNANNTSTITCQVTDKTQKYGVKYRSYTNGYTYYLYVPADLSKRNQLPLVVYIPGKNNSGHVFRTRYADGVREKFGFMAFEEPSSEWNVDTIMKAINGVLNQYPFAKDQVTITGYSRGANALYRVIKSYPNFFAAAVPLAGSATYSDSLLRTTIWAFHGADDQSVSYTDAKELLDHIIAGNPKSKFTTIPNYGHSIPKVVYNRDDLLTYFMEVKR